MSKLSPAPWKSRGAYVVDAQRNIVCDVLPYPDALFNAEEVEQYESNARLIAEAPEMCSMLRRVADLGYVLTVKELQDINALLDRIDGKQRAKS